MLVFTLPSFPYVFKIIKDVFGASKNMDRATVKRKYLMVKHRRPRRAHGGHAGVLLTPRCRWRASTQSCWKSCARWHRPRSRSTATR